MTTERELIRYALYDAIDWQRSIAASYSDMPTEPARLKALKRSVEYRKLLRKFGGSDRAESKAALAQTAEEGR